MVDAGDSPALREERDREVSMQYARASDRRNVWNQASAVDCSEGSLMRGNFGACR
jgi:hypothetical protein